ncbi:PepSY-associated TM helix domain-containing protein [Emcibacter nanhaiensis]|uniref:PepSY domain-containing protein n=1 Tax=Emcibacter nanhaiensis TaxID=1505037 RepID=A0A501PKL9_9PROT|nr:PepSY-associated TM helix domain-containing protein [Emcibacter nanhaiensis]TPD60622.1 PepSY domain-containing protein [Emcibacter nanhaiensis]
MILRRYHRWAGLVASLVLIFVAITGIGLQLDLWLTGQAPPGTEAPPAPRPRQDLPDNVRLETLIVQAADIIREQRPDISAEAITLTFAENRTTATVGSTMPFGPKVTVDLANGQILPPLPKPAGYHLVLQNLHAGYSFDLIGRIISVLLGVSLLLLSGTGFFFYIDMYKKRKKGGKSGLFWK